MTSNSTRRRFGRVAAAMITLLFAPLALVVGSAGSASAANVTGGVNLRPCVDTSRAVCAPVGTTGGGGSLWKMRCWRDGSWAVGNYGSNRWFLVVLADGREGYVHSSFVTNQYATPACTTLGYVRAADQALSYIDQVYAPAAIRDAYSTASWSPGPKGEWSGDCAKLTHSSYVYGAGVSYPLANAIDQYWWFKNRGLISGGIPRYGAPVFYDIARPYGHTAIYIGGTTIITTQGMDWDSKPVARRDLYSYGSYLGWAVTG